MPVKIGFQVISSTGEDDRFKAAELNYHSPTVRGWRSSANCTFPQEIIIQLKELAVLHQIQILAHQYIIPHKVEICTSSKMDCITSFENSMHVFEYLGFITFSDNRATGFRSRELKSILIPCRKAKYVKLRIHSNHANIKNTLNQVALMAVNVHGKAIDGETNNNVCCRSTTSSVICNSNYISPYDDLAFEMYVDQETAKIIKIIETKKFQAICEERFDYANQLKITLENLRAAGEILGLYEQEKKHAINLEDYDRAKAKKLQIDKYRRKVYTVLQVQQLLGSNDFLGKHAERDQIVLPVERETSPQLSPYQISTNNSSISAPDDCSNMHQSNSSSQTMQNTFLNHLIQSKSLTKTSENPNIVSPSFYVFSSSMPTSQIHQYLRGTPLKEHETGKVDDREYDAENVRTPSPESSSSSAYESVHYKASDKSKYPSKKPEIDFEHSLTNSLILPRNTRIPVRATESVNISKYRCYSVSPKSPPNHFNGTNTLTTSLSDYKIRDRGIETSVAKSSFEAYEDKMLPALKSYHGNEVVRECQLVLDQPRKSALNEREKKQAVLPISVFGIEMIEKFYSKNFSDKEEGLKQLQQELKKRVDSRNEDPGTKVPSFNRVARAAIFLLHRALRDKVFSVYSFAAETVRLFFAEFVPHRVSSAEVARSVEKLLPELLTKSGDVTPRIHNMAAHTLLSMAECKDVRRLNIIPVHLSRPLASSVHPRLALSRLEMVEQLILNHGISKDKKSGLTCRTLAEFGSSGLHHPAEPVRKVSERILIQVYKANPRIVRKQLPPDDNVTRRNLLYRQLFQEFDFMDSQRKENEYLPHDPNSTLEINKLLRSETHERHCNYTDKDVKCKKIGPDNLKLEALKTCILINKSEREKALAQKELGQTFAKTSSESPKEQNKNYFEHSYDLKVKERKYQNAVKSQLINKNEKNKNLNSSRVALKFPALTDSIDTIKARILLDQKKDIKVKKQEYTCQKDQTGRLLNSNLSLLKNTGSIVKKKGKSFSSNIPVPVFGPGQKFLINSLKNLDKEQQLLHSNMSKENCNSNILKSRLPKKVLKIKTLESEELGELLDNPTEKNMVKKLDAKASTETITSSLVKHSEKEKKENLKGNARLSESMLASLNHVSSDLEEVCHPPKSCIFCLSSKEWTTEDGLNDHYLKDCLMLTTCKYCMEVVEISGFTNHLLDECKRRHLFQKCSSCKEAIIKDIYDIHQCKASNIENEKQRCPFCQTDIGVGDSCWRKHLMENNICLKHPRQKQNSLLPKSD